MLAESLAKKAADRRARLQASVGLTEEKSEPKAAMADEGSKAELADAKPEAEAGARMSTRVSKEVGGVIDWMTSPGSVKDLLSKPFVKEEQAAGPAPCQQDDLFHFIDGAGDQHDPEPASALKEWLDQGYVTEGTFVWADVPALGLNPRLCRRWPCLRLVLP